MADLEVIKTEGRLLLAELPGYIARSIHPRLVPLSPTDPDYRYHHSYSGAVVGNDPRPRTRQVS